MLDFKYNSLTAFPGAQAITKILLKHKDTFWVAPYNHTYHLLNLEAVVCISKRHKDGEI